MNLLIPFLDWFFNCVARCLRTFLRTEVQVTDTASEQEEMTEAEYEAELAAEIDKISDHDVRAALVNHSLILKSFDKILTALADRQMAVERIIVTLIGGAVAPKSEAPTPTNITVPPGQYL